MQTYINLLNDIIENGKEKSDRTGTGTYSVFGRQLRFDLNEGFPLLTTKKVYWRAIVHELLWFLKGDTNIKYLNDNDVHIWDEWATDNGDLGPVYGKMWRDWPNGETSIDQINEVINELLFNPTSRRIIVSGWNPSLLPNANVSPKENAAHGKQALPPCHTLFQFMAEPLDVYERAEIAGYTLDGTHGSIDMVNVIMDNEGIPEYRLSCQLYQRSADVFLGVPFNIASYALLTHIIADIVGMLPGTFVHTFGDVHIYKNHVDQVKEQMKREPRQLPQLKIRNRREFGLSVSPESYEYDDFELIGYDPHPAIKAKVSV